MTLSPSILPFGASPLRSWTIRDRIFLQMDFAQVFIQMILPLETVLTFTMAFLLPAVVLLLTDAVHIGIVPAHVKGAP